MSIPETERASNRPTTALVLGIVGIACCQLTGPFAWILGAKELRSIREGRSPETGRGFAQAGLIMGIIGTVLLLLSLLILPAIMVPAFVKAREQAREKQKQQGPIGEMHPVGEPVVLLAHGSDVLARAHAKSQPHGYLLIGVAG